MSYESLDVDLDVDIAYFNAQLSLGQRLATPNSYLITHTSLLGGIHFAS